MELKRYLDIIQHWAWLIVLGLVLGAATGFFYSERQTPVYQASTKVLILRPPQQTSSDTTYLSDQQMLQTYIQMATTTPVLSAASSELGYTIDPKQITVNQIVNTQILQITVENENPQRAADIANTLVQVLIDQYEKLQSTRFTDREQSLQSQIDQIQSQIANLQTQIDQQAAQNIQEQIDKVVEQMNPLQQEASQLKQEIASLSPAFTPEIAAQIAEKEARLNEIEPIIALYQQIYSNLLIMGESGQDNTSQDAKLSQMQTTLNLYQQIYLNLISSLESVRLAQMQNASSATQIEPAIVPIEPVRPKPMQNTALAGIVGLVIASGVVFLIEYLDDKLKSPEEIEEALQSPILGLIAEIESDRRDPNGIYVSQEPRSPVSEAFRSLRTNLEYTGMGKPLKTVLVTSLSPEEGKTTIAVNLAGVLSQEGKRVILLDADLRKPKVHQLIGLNNRIGLTSLFKNIHSLDMVLNSVFQDVENLPNLKVITSGSLPPNPTELLNSEFMVKILEKLKEQYDIIIIDSPPSLVADALIISTKVDGFLFVVRPGFTQAKPAMVSVESLKRSGAKMLGVVVNRIPRNRAYYYGGYQHYYSYDQKYYAYSSGQKSKVAHKE
ncbi:MAG TPA: polysaccharide biosynthesis tyrosine autokinase [Bacteroidales bacterium]|nr:polysaccharide biosynthesis tyrosine autokinase [Bacteroidales bacterium]